MAKVKRANMLKAMQAMPTKSWLVLLFSIAVFVVGVDQVTKEWVKAVFDDYQRVEVTAFFDLVLAYNKGAAWSMFNDSTHILTIVSFVASIGLSYWIVSLKGEQRLLGFALAFVLGGAVGNLIDRALFGQVTDFLSFHWNDSYFPAFNVADSAITLGAILLIYESLFVQSDKNDVKEGSDD